MIHKWIKKQIFRPTGKELLCKFRPGVQSEAALRTWNSEGGDLNLHGRRGNRLAWLAVLSLDPPLSDESSWSTSPVLHRRKWSMIKWDIKTVSISGVRWCWYRSDYFHNCYPALLASRHMLIADITEIASCGRELRGRRRKAVYPREIPRDTGQSRHLRPGWKCSVWRLCWLECSASVFVWWLSWRVWGWWSLQEATGPPVHHSTLRLIKLVQWGKRLQSLRSQGGTSAASALHIKTETAAPRRITSQSVRALLGGSHILSGRHRWVGFSDANQIGIILTRNCGCIYHFSTQMVFAVVYISSYI